MRRRRAPRALSLVVAMVMLAAIMACSSSDSSEAVVVRLTSAKVTVAVRAEVAADEASRARGLMGRKEIPPGTGMLFLFPRPARQSFWMKNTLVPLDIAFIRDRRVIEVRTMTPCRADPCPLTTSSEPADAALEAAAGSIQGIEPAATVTYDGSLPAAA